VQITRILPSTGLLEESLGTVVEGGYAIITHNHFGFEKAERVIISDHNYREIITFDDEDDILKDPFINNQTLRWVFPEKLEGRSVAAIGDASALGVGDTVSLPYVGNRNRLGIEHLTIDLIIRASRGTGTLQAVMSNNEEKLKGGDSGGGLFHDGRLVGNTWWVLPDYHLNNIPTPVVSSALLLP
jgi:hypothetical protein